MIEYDEFLQKYTVFFLGDEVVFDTEEEAKKFCEEEGIENV